MIRTENIDNRIHTYSDTGMKIRQEQTGIVYDDAIDVPSKGYTYVETDIPIENDISPEEALAILLGGEPNEQTESD